MHDDINIRSSSFLLARTVAVCPHCHASTPVFALAVPPGHVTLQLDDAESEESAVDSWEIAAHHALLFEIELLDPLVAIRLERLAPDFRKARSGNRSDGFWVNHCALCAAAIDDAGLFCEPEGAFLPITEAGAELIHLLAVDEPFKAATSGYAHEPQFFDAMVRD